MCSKLTYFILYICLLFYPKYSFGLTDSEYFELMNSCPSFKDAEDDLNKVWSKYYRTVDIEARKYVLDNQKQWIKYGRDNEANELISKGYEKCLAYTSSVRLRIYSLNPSNKYHTDVKNNRKLIKDVKDRADNGSAFDQYGLGLLYLTGTSVNKDYNKAKYYFELASDQDFALAQHYLGDMYYYGKGVPQNYQIAYNYYKLASKQGVTDSIFHVGYMHYNGIGVNKDYHIAKIYFDEAANQRDKFAYYYLASMYENGEGVRQNIYKAKEMYGRACDEGYEDGCKRYKELNIKGY